uniref:ATP synthase complex subunit 8 n=1 Tax=Sisyra aurorae TaxID=2835442 RepID=A0A8F0WI19_9NEOP|nr:atp8 [Sisyra aurorae]
MPQMAPINWLTLFIYFTFIMIIFNIMNYYIFSFNLPKNENKNFLKTPLNWKW